LEQMESLPLEKLPYVDKEDRWSSHTLISRYLAGYPNGTRILDIGTASGTMGRMCAGSGFVLDGIEPEMSWAAMARPYYRNVLCCTLDLAPQDFLQDHQVVILADVLEHLPNPEKALRQLVSLQPKGAVFIISVPNVANLWVRLNLLFGRFDYTNRGILDRTHLRFFTRKTLIEMLGETGLSARRLDVTPIPLNLVHPFFGVNSLGRSLHGRFATLTRIFPNLLGYQFIVEATK
jgi:2-polyprenyl-3-methyl-5-hydroxy-6-metoxy-1,4-benzoquinol methylase